MKNGLVSQPHMVVNIGKNISAVEVLTEYEGSNPYARITSLEHQCQGEELS